MEPTCVVGVECEFEVSSETFVARAVDGTTLWLEGDGKLRRLDRYGESVGDPIRLKHPTTGKDGDVIYPVTTGSSTWRGNHDILLLVYFGASSRPNLTRVDANTSNVTKVGPKHSPDRGFFSPNQRFFAEFQKNRIERWRFDPERLHFSDKQVQPLSKRNPHKSDSLLRVYDDGSCGFQDGTPGKGFGIWSPEAKTVLRTPKLHRHSTNVKRIGGRWNRCSGQVALGRYLCTIDFHRASKQYVEYRLARASDSLRNKCLARLVSLLHPKDERALPDEETRRIFRGFVDWTNKVSC